MIRKTNNSLVTTPLGSAALALALALACSGQAHAPDERAAAAYPAYHGPKKTIAVSKFDAVGSFVARYGGWDLGGGLAAMLTSELARTNRFVVVERADIDTLLREKQMTLSDVTRGASGAPLVGAQTFIHASVVAFDEQTKGGGLNLGLNLPGLGTGGLGMRGATGHVTIELRLIDGATGAVLATSRVERKVRSSAIALQGRIRNVSFGGDHFNQTALGQASREAIAQAVAQIVAGMERVPFQALVAKVDGDRVFLNAGRNANLAPGSRMRITRTVDTVCDPISGEVLGGTKVGLADIVVEQIEDRYAVARVVTGSGRPARADIAQLVNP